ncbi:RT0821/Lpp0805 family surface protein [Endobacterium cereale]|uniref:RT0821/Lpp0805 family surface protein n=1 Tax=Endobacterium cereale TaxID=2663029 RepID=UPI001EFF31C9|nr:RT0821/Lpp0805 family surface protein [Endobacterium cereale]MEB2847020.1 RT0821/Lpp0805 family surface protein [Endobacterium cereale]
MALIAKTESRTSQTRAFAARGFAIAAVIATLSGCTSSLDLFGGDKVDRMSTGTIQAKRNPTTMSDEVTVQNAVSSADLTKVSMSPLPWANTSTGSAGVVSSIREGRNQGHVCRDFITTRHSFEGIAQFNGQTCMTNSGDWMLTAFDRQ